LQGKKLEREERVGGAPANRQGRVKAAKWLDKKKKESSVNAAQKEKTEKKGPGGVSKRKKKQYKTISVKEEK